MSSSGLRSPGGSLLRAVLRRSTSKKKNKKKKMIPTQNIKQPLQARDQNSPSKIALRAAEKGKPSAATPSKSEKKHKGKRKRLLLEWMRKKASQPGSAIKKLKNDKPASGRAADAHITYRKRPEVSKNVSSTLCNIRCRLYALGSDSAWVDRGIGHTRVVLDQAQNKYSVEVRQAETKAIRANFNVNSRLEQNGNRGWMVNAHNFYAALGVVQKEMFAFKFKSTETANSFAQAYAKGLEHNERVNAQGANKTPHKQEDDDVGEQGAETEAEIEEEALEQALEAAEAAENAAGDEGDGSDDLSSGLTSKNDDDDGVGSAAAAVTIDPAGPQAEASHAGSTFPSASADGGTAAGKSDICTNADDASTTSSAAENVGIIGDNVAEVRAAAETAAALAALKLSDAQAEADALKVEVALTRQREKETAEELAGLQQRVIKAEDELKLFRLEMEAEAEGREDEQTAMLETREHARLTLNNVLAIMTQMKGLVTVFETELKKSVRDLAPPGQRGVDSDSDDDLFEGVETTEGKEDGEA